MADPITFMQIFSSSVNLMNLVLVVGTPVKTHLILSLLPCLLRTLKLLLLCCLSSCTACCHETNAKLNIVSKNTPEVLLDRKLTKMRKKLFLKLEGGS